MGLVVSYKTKPNAGLRQHTCFGFAASAFFNNRLVQSIPGIYLLHFNWELSVLFVENAMLQKLASGYWLNIALPKSTAIKSFH